MAISPDGSKLVYAANERLYIKSLDSLEELELQVPSERWGPFFFARWSVSWLSFTSVLKRKYPISGEAVEIICTVADPIGASWGPDNTILIGGIFRGILRVSANGGNPVVIVPPASSLA